MSVIDSPSATTFTTCPLCGASLDAANPNECPRCDWVSGYRRQQNRAMHPASPQDFAALVMSVVPGLGQFYKGYRLAGVVVAIGALLTLLFVLATVSATAGVALALIPIYWGAAGLHAFWADAVSHHTSKIPARAVPER